MKKFIKVIYALGFLAVIGAIVLGAFLYSVSRDLPEINTLKDYKPSVPSKIYSADNTVLLELYKEKRDVVAYEDIPKRVLGAFLAAEDDNFYSHSGVDFVGLVRAFFKNLKAGRVVQGGSTITQQVAKSFLLSSERSYLRKIKDILLALRIEQKLSKIDILYLYLNQVYLGGGYYGIKAAFKGYFGKELEEATVSESALVAGLLVAPGKYSPYVNPQYAKARQRYVLKRMFETKKITNEEYQAALVEDIRMNVRVLPRLKAPYFTDWIRQQVMKKLGSDEVLTGGYTIKTTLDWELQDKAEKSLKEGLLDVDKRQGFKGPIRKIEPDKYATYNTEMRQEYYKKKSSFFDFTSEGKNKYELNFDDETMAKLADYEKDMKSVTESTYFKTIPVGVMAEDLLLSKIKKDDIFEAVVKKISNQQKLIYVEFMGLKGAIPESGYKWAHKRKLNDKYIYQPLMERPTTILNPGDIIKVRVRGELKSAWSLMSGNYRNRIKSAKNMSYVKEQKFVPLDLYQDIEVQAALFSIDPKTGHIISMVGGSDFSVSKFNRAVQAKRQPGSSFKPFIFASALENGYTAGSSLLDSPQSLAGVDDTLSWKPKNYDNKFLGSMTLRRALEVSRNIPTIKIVQDLGVKKLGDFSKRVGINAKMPQDLSISLGAFGISLMDLVKSYSIFPNGGKKIEVKYITSITDREGKELLQDEDYSSESKKLEVNKAKESSTEIEKVATGINSEKKNNKENIFHITLKGDQVYDRRLAHIMTNLLKGVVKNGTGRSARSVSPFIGGKTGTTNSYVDAWFVGFGKTAVTGVWVGFDSNKTLGYGETGTKAALPIWKGYMSPALKKLGDSEFVPPAGIVNVAIDSKTGKLSSGSGDVYVESFVRGTEPGAENSLIEDTLEDGSTITTDDDYYYDQ